MDKAAFDNYIESRYKVQMEYYSGKATTNQKNYKRFQWILIILSATTPVMAALNEKPFKFFDKVYSLDLQIFVIVIAAIVAILTTGLKTFAYQELWITYRSTYERLKPEIYYYNFGVGPYAAAGIDKESLFVTRVEALLDKEHSQWPAAKKSNEEENETKDTDNSNGDNENSNGSSVKENK